MRVLATVPALHHGEVHVWHARMDELDVSDGMLRAALSPDEVDRADRFRFSSDASRFLRRRWLRGRLLAAYGADPGGGGPLRCSASSSDGMAVVALARDRDVGVDVERRRAVADRDLLVRATMTGEEQAVLAAEGGGRDAAFLRLWTVKEAFMKVLGSGLSLEPRRVSSTPVGPGRWTVSSPGGTPSCTALGVDVDGSYLATLAVPGRVECVAEHVDDIGEQGVQLVRVVVDPQPPATDRLARA